MQKYNKLKKLASLGKELDILIVEDNGEVRINVKKMLSNIFNDNIDTAVDGLDGLEKYNTFFKTHHKFYDIVVSDISMPNMDGIELSKQLTNINRSQIIIILSAHSESEKLVDLINIGISKFIQKPISSKNLIDVSISVLNIIKYRKANGENKELLDEVQSLKKENIIMEKKAMTDKLTQLHNRHFIDTYLEKEFLSSKRHKNKLSLILIDLDNFKNINDTYGHSKGDKVLINIASILKNFIRKSDIIGRWGGEEFIVVCKETDLNGAFHLANYLREKIEQADCDMCSNITASFGVTSIEKFDKTFNCIISKADKALYSSKNSGKNKVSFI